MGIREFGRRLAHLFRMDQFASDLEEEMRLHIELRARKLRTEGMPEEEARHVARRQFGNRGSIHETSSELWGWPAWERLAQDVRLALRTLRKTPAFTIVAALTLALGLGMNTAVFSLVNAVMIRSLPYQEPSRLVSLWEERVREGPPNMNSSGPAMGGRAGPQRSSVAPANLMDYQQRNHAFRGLAGVGFSAMNWTGDGPPERLTGQSVTANFFPLLGVEPAHGRTFLAEEDQPGANGVTVISHEFWQRHLGGDRNVLGRTLTLDGHPYRVIGVLPPRFRSPSQFGLPEPIEFYVPAAYPAELLANHGDHEINVLGRLKPGVSIESAQAELEAISASLAQQYPDSNRGLRAAIAPLQADIVRNFKDSLFALLGASGLIVLITCVNVANLLLVRALARRHETSVRFALGASRFRIVRQYLAESMLVAAAGCGAGIALGRAMMRLLVAIAPPNTPMLDRVAMDWRVFAVSTALATLTGVAFGIAPAWQASRTKPAESLKSTERKGGSPSQSRGRMALTIAEVALSMILLVGAGLLLKSFVLVLGVDLGFQPDRVLAMNINLPEVRYRTAVQRLQFFEQLDQRVRTLPGVQSVAFANRMPMRGGWGSGVMLDGSQAYYDSDFQAVSPGYFETLGIPLLRGRLLTPQDRTGQPLVAVVNQAFARSFLNNANPVGRRLRRNREAPWVTIMGVVNDIRRDGKTGRINPQVYLSAAQTELYPVRLADFAVRTAGDPRQLVNAIQTQVWALDKDQPVTAVRTMEEIISASVAQRRFQTLLLLVFAAMAVGLAMIGIFGVVSYSVSQRTAELGIRIALGAAPRAILALVLTQAGALIVAGVVFGLAGAWALTRYLESLLFDVKPHDWRTYLAAVALLAAVSIAAALIPARRGARVDPIVALRYE